MARQSSNTATAETVGQDIVNDGSGTLEIAPESTVSARRRRFSHRTRTAPRLQEDALALFADISKNTFAEMYVNMYRNSVDATAQDADILRELLPVKKSGRTEAEKLQAKMAALRAKIANLERLEAEINAQSDK